jgi:hypothetical protein
MASLPAYRRFPLPRELRALLFSRALLIFVIT